MSAQIDVDKVLTELKGIAARAGNEEELRINAERILYNEVLSTLGLQPGRYEYTFVSGGRADALYGHVLIEYKAPAKLSRPPEVAKAKEQLIGYIKKEAEVEERYRLFLGVILCDKIAFVRYDDKSKDWPMRGPYDLNRETVLRLIEAIRGLRRKRLAVDELLRDFGPESEIATKAVKVFYDRITKSKSPKAKALFNDWKRLFSQVCAYSPEKLKGLEIEYRIGGHIDYDALLFSIHTYYALIMKLLGAEVAYLYGAGKWLKSYVGELEDAHMKGSDTLKTALDDLESGGVFRKLLNITNFMEGDYFSWYLEELDEGLAGVISDMAKELGDYEPATPVLEPEYTRDLLKRLYQNLVPKKIRHDLGEYYTPDWLAELVLNEVGLTVESFEKISQEKNDSLAPLNSRILDPACGSGTFLVLTMKRIREYAEEHYLKEVLADYLLRNVVGFDLNPLAVLAARTNYLLTAADLFPYVKGSVEIPIYLSDSLLVEERTTLTSRTYAIRTYVGEFQIPQSIVEKGLLVKLLEAVDRYVRLRYKAEDFEQVTERELDLDGNELRLAAGIYKTFLELEEDGKNHVWTSIIKNAFAPFTITRSVGKFDYVVGNPPWVNWESLPEIYRKETRHLWEAYGLLRETGTRARARVRGLGKVRRDLATLFISRSFDRYVGENGILGFLLPFNVLKAQGGAGFRNFLTNRVRVTLVHELSELYPFEGATNRTGLIVITAGKTKFPIRCTVWFSNLGILQDSELKEVMKETRQKNMHVAPIDTKNPESPWALLTEKAREALKKVIRQSAYVGREGTNPALTGVFWVTILTKDRNGLLVENLGGAKRKVETIREVVDPDLVYPLVRGRDVKKWFASPKDYIIVPHETKDGKPLSERELRTKFHRTYGFFSNFRKSLEDRSIHKLWGRGNPFYSLYGIGGYTFEPFKVLWKDISGKISAKGEFGGAVVPDVVSDEYLGKKQMIPDGTLMFVRCGSYEEAHYIAAVLNSTMTRLIAKAYSVLHVRAHVLKYVGIREYDPKNDRHRQLSQLSKEAHRLSKEYRQNNDPSTLQQLRKVEDQIDGTLALIYGITSEELTEIKRSLAILNNEEVEEEEAEEEPKEVKVDFLDAVARPNVIGSFEVAVSNPLTERITIELRLPDRSVKIETDKEEDRIPVKVPGLKAGEYKVPYSISTSKGIVKGEFTLCVKEEEKRRVREAFTARLDELLGD